MAFDYREYDEVFQAFLRGEFAFVISRLETLTQSEPCEALPDGVFQYQALARYFSGDFEGAIRDYNQWLSRDGDSLLALNGLAYIFACCPDDSLHCADLAIRLATRACDVSDWKQWRPLLVLAYAFARNNDFENATIHARKSLEIVPVEKRDRPEILLELAKTRQAFTSDLTDEFNRYIEATRSL